jgi:hypothetical protein
LKIPILIESCIAHEDPTLIDDGVRSVLIGELLPGKEQAVHGDGIVTFLVAPGVEMRNYNGDCIVHGFGILGDSSG